MSKYKVENEPTYCSIINGKCPEKTDGERTFCNYYCQLYSVYNDFERRSNELEAEKSWVYGYLCDQKHINSPELEGDMLIDPGSICQYTGLIDKNGRKIFEGDICRNKQGKLYKVEYWSSICRFVLVINTGIWSGIEADYDTSSFVCSEIEVIGNIFDNPELIEEADK